jgi:hypothetical protein
LYRVELYFKTLDNNCPMEFHRHIHRRLEQCMEEGAAVRGGFLLHTGLELIYCSLKGNGCVSSED